MWRSTCRSNAGDLREGGVNALGGNIGADVTEVISVGIYAYAVLRTAEITSVIAVIVIIHADSHNETTVPGRKRQLPPQCHRVPEGKK